MPYNKTINLLIFDGDPNGRMMAELSNWNGRVYKIARNALTVFSERDDAENTGVYFLFGRDINNNGTIYVGEAEHMFTRLKQHVNDQEYWTDCVAVISKDDHLNKAHVKYLEHEFYDAAKSAGRYVIVNSTIPTRSSVSEYDAAMLLEFFDYTKLLVNTMGYKAFDSISQAVDTGVSFDTFLLTGPRGADAKGILTADGFTVLKGSMIADGVTRSYPSSINKIRARLLQDGIIDSEYKFTKDYLFSSPSYAAAVVLGRNANGRTEWLTETGQTLKSIEEARLA